MQICGNAMQHLYYTGLQVFLWLRLVELRNATVKMIWQHSSQKDTIRSMYVHTKKQLNFKRQTSSPTQRPAIRSISHIFDTY